MTATEKIYIYYNLLSLMLLLDTLRQKKKNSTSYFIICQLSVSQKVKWSV